MIDCGFTGPVVLVTRFADGLEVPPAMSAAAEDEEVRSVLAAFGWLVPSRGTHARCAALVSQGALSRVSVSCWLWSDGEGDLRLGLAGTSRPAAKGLLDTLLWLAGVQDEEDEGDAGAGAGPEGGAEDAAVGPGGDADDAGSDVEMDAGESKRGAGAAGKAAKGAAAGAAKAKPKPKAGKQAAAAEADDDAADELGDDLDMDAADIEFDSDIEAAIASDDDDEFAARGDE